MKKLKSIQLIRAVAVWAVVIGHASTMSPAAYGEVNDLTLFLYQLGAAYVSSGVDLFFVVSGFVICIITAKRNQTGRMGELFTFCAKRFLKVYPLFWVTFLATILPQSVIKFAEWRNWIYQLTLLETPANHGVAWSLVLELRFYVLAAGFLLFAPRRDSLCYLIFAGSIALLIGLAEMSIIPTSTFTRPIMLEFAFGIVVAIAHQDRWTMAPTAALAVGCMALIAAIVFLFNQASYSFVNGQFIGVHNDFDFERYRVLIFGLPATLIVFGLVGIERDNNLNVPGWAVRLGDTSYSTYLWHSVILVVVAEYWPVQSHLIGLLAFGVLSVAITFAVSELSYELIEKPCHAAGNLSGLPARLST